MIIVKTRAPQVQKDHLSQRVQRERAILRRQQQLLPGERHEHVLHRCKYPPPPPKPQFPSLSPDRQSVCMQAFMGSLA